MIICDHLRPSATVYDHPCYYISALSSEIGCELPKSHYQGSRPKAIVSLADVFARAAFGALYPNGGAIKGRDAASINFPLQRSTVARLSPILGRTWTFLDLASRENLVQSFRQNSWHAVHEQPASSQQAASEQPASSHKHRTWQ